MKTILEKLATLKKTKSTLAKMDLLKTYLNDDLFRMVVEMALDGNLHYNIQKLPKASPHATTPYDWENLSNYLYNLAQKQGASNTEKQLLADMCSSPEAREVVLKILNKDLSCGVGPGLINQVIPDCLTIYPYMRCSTSAAAKNVSYPAYFQNKEDGLFLNIFVFSNRVEYKTRNGNDLIFPEKSREEEILATFPVDERVYMGEARIKGKNGKWLSRKISNGIVNKALKKNQTMQIHESQSIHFILWDSVTMEEFRLGKSMVPYKTRLKYIEWLNTEGNSEYIHLSETQVVYSFKEAQDLAIEKIAIDEGGVLKDMEAIWFDGTSTKQIKLKAGDLGIEGAERECELRVTEIYFGKQGSKYENFLGGLMCESEDGELNTNIGGGFSDEQRLFPGFDDNGEIKPHDTEQIMDKLEEMYVGKIITVRFNEIIRDGKGNKPRLFLARFLEVRHDKNKADTLKQIEEICGGRNGN